MSPSVRPEKLSKKGTGKKKGTSSSSSSSSAIHRHHDGHHNSVPSTRKTASLPDLNECTPAASARGQKVNLPKITKSRDSALNASNPLPTQLSPVTKRILEKLSELISSPWPSNAPTPLLTTPSASTTSLLPPRPPSSAPSRKGAGSLVTAGGCGKTVKSGKGTRNSRSTGSLEHQQHRRGSVGVSPRRGSSESSLPELSARIGVSSATALPVVSVGSVEFDESGDEGETEEAVMDDGGDGSGPGAALRVSRSAPGTPPVSADARNRIGRQCLALKRIMDKEGLHAESSIQRTLFSKTNPNVSVLIKCLRVVPDLDITIIVTNLLLRLTMSSEQNASNTAYVARKSLSIALFKCLQNIFREHIKADGRCVVFGVANAVQRIDELLVNVYTLLVKIAKFDAKLALLARLHGAVPSTIIMIKKWNERKEYGLMIHGFHALRVFTVKNENNVNTIQKSKVVNLLAALIKNPILAPTLTQHPAKMECLLDLLTILAKSKAGAVDVLEKLHVKDLIQLFTNANSETVQRCVLKLLKTVVETEDGKNAFNESNGVGVLTMALDDLVQACEAGNGTPLTTGATSLPTLLVSVLRSAVSQSDLPFLDRYTALTFPLPRTSNEQPQPLDATRLNQLFPELHPTPPHTAHLPITNIEVRHVQPITGRQPLLGHRCVEYSEPVLRRGASLVRKLVYEQMRRVVRPEESANAIVYDVTDDRISGPEGSLEFDSRFESGNLQMAVKISDTEYDLLLQTDINAPMGKHNQWFYFSIQNMAAGRSYKFNIINLSKMGSQFNQGMQPVMHSRVDGLWRRIGDDIYYYKNHHKKPEESDTENNTYATLTFSITPEHDGDTCSFAYHYPYTYSDLQRHLFQFQITPTFSDRCRRQILCHTLGGNECVLLTITDFTEASLAACPIADRIYILLSARVHPGESNASHIMHGLLTYLLTSGDDTASQLRRRCVFKVVPMLNPDGVVNGSHRCSLAGVDLNRQWKTPDAGRVPTIAAIKALWKHVIESGRKVLLTCDFHGHSRRKNVFLFGCENAPGSPHETLERTFPTLLAQVSPTFSLPGSRFDVQPSKESTARVIVRRELGVVNSFTLESSYCGADFGDKKGLQFQIPDHQQSGLSFCHALRALLDIPPPWSVSGEINVKLPSPQLPFSSPNLRPEDAKLPQNGDEDDREPLEKLLEGDDDLVGEGPDADDIDDD
ncbi:Cytosolic carboxypeptidase 1 [Geranomyces michiganensis]|nr:Cytosolic carboxypeptidase 1 [Geranomyces michiganensis]